jgi:uncharacterized cupin superfamily protein
MRSSNIIPGQATEGGNSSAKHPYMKNNFMGTPEIQETMRKIYEVRDRIKQQ